MAAFEPALTYHSAIGQSAWLDLLRLLQDRAVGDLRGKPLLKTVGQRHYWYDRFRLGAEVVDRYIGEDTPDLRDRLARHQALRDAARASDAAAARLLRVLRAEGYLIPDVATGQILSALAGAGTFRLGGTLVGTQAFRMYEGVLGVRIGFDAAAMTDDIDIASFERLSVVLQDQTDPALPDAFAALKFDPVPASDPGRVWRWRQSQRGTLIEFLTPAFGAPEGLRDLPALGVSAQALNFLNYLIADPIAAPVLYRSGVLAQIPRPERYAIHKLIVADRRRVGDQKSTKDRAQAAFLIRVLAEERPHDLADAYQAAITAGPAWRQALDASLSRMPETAARIAGLPG